MSSPLQDVNDDVAFESALDDVVRFIKQRRRDLGDPKASDAAELDDVDTRSTPLSIHGTRADRDRALLALPTHLPAQGLGTLATTSLLLSSILPGCLQAQPSSRYFGFVTGGVTASAQLADALVTALDENVQVCLPEVTISTALEARTLNLVLDLLEIRAETFTGKTLTTGATASNMLGLAVGRDAVIARRGGEGGAGGGLAYEHGVAEDGYPPHVLGPRFSDDGESGDRDDQVWHPSVLVLTSRTAAHGSILKAAALTGIGRRNVVGIPPKQSLPAGGNQTSHAALPDQTDEVGVATKAGSSSGIAAGDADANATPSDDPYGLGMDEVILERRLCHAKTIGQGVIVVITLGEVNTGGITPGVERVAKLCRRYDAWLHVDAAFGGFGAILPELANYKIRQSMELSDSLTLDAHKWLNVPYDCAMFYTRQLSDLVRTTGPSPSTGMPAYLRPSAPLHGDDRGGTSQMDPRVDQLRCWAATVPSPLNVGIENSRRFRALPLFASLMELGKEGYVDIVRRNCEFANAVAKWMLDPSLGGKYYELVNCVASPSTQDSRVVPLNVVLFRALDSSPFGSIVDGNAALLARLNGSRLVYFTGTVWAGRPAIRMAVSNARTARYADAGKRASASSGRVQAGDTEGQKRVDSESWLAVTSTLMGVMTQAEEETRRK